MRAAIVCWPKFRCSNHLYRDSRLERGKIKSRLLPPREEMERSPPTSGDCIRPLKRSQERSKAETICLRRELQQRQLWPHPFEWHLEFVSVSFISNDRIEHEIQMERPAQQVADDGHKCNIKLMLIDRVRWILDAIDSRFESTKKNNKMDNVCIWHMRIADRTPRTMMITYVFVRPASINAIHLNIG